MQVRMRIERRLLVPIGSAAKALDNLKIKIASLELPPRAPGLPEPTQVLLQPEPAHALLQPASEGNGTDPDETPGGSAKRQRVS